MAINKQIRCRSCGTIITLKEEKVIEIKDKVNKNGTYITLPEFDKMFKCCDKPNYLYMANISEIDQTIKRWTT